MRSVRNTHATAAIQVQPTRSIVAAKQPHISKNAKAVRALGLPSSARKHHPRPGRHQMLARESGANGTSAPGANTTYIRRHGSAP